MGVWEKWGLRRRTVFWVSSCRHLLVATPRRSSSCIFTLCLHGQPWVLPAVARSRISLLSVFSLHTPGTILACSLRSWKLLTKSPFLLGGRIWTTRTRAVSSRVPEVESWGSVTPSLQFTFPERAYPTFSVGSLEVSPKTTAKTWRRWMRDARGQSFLFLLFFMDA